MYFPQEAEEAPAEARDPTKFVAKKSKAAAKKGAGATQWDILKMSGIPEADIPAFADPAHWLRFFPPLAVRDLKAMGCGVDWRRRCARAGGAGRGSGGGGRWCCCCWGCCESEPGRAAPGGEGRACGRAARLAEHRERDFADARCAALRCAAPLAARRAPLSLCCSRSFFIGVFPAPVAAS